MGTKVKNRQGRSWETGMQKKGVKQNGEIKKIQWQNEGREEIKSARKRFVVGSSWRGR